MEEVEWVGCRRGKNCEGKVRDRKGEADDERDRSLTG